MSEGLQRELALTDEDFDRDAFVRDLEANSFSAELERQASYGPEWYDPPRAGSMDQKAICWGCLETFTAWAAPYLLAHLTDAHRHYCWRCRKETPPWLEDGEDNGNAPSAAAAMPKMRGQRASRAQKKARPTAVLQ